MKRTVQLAIAAACIVIAALAVFRSPAYRTGGPEKAPAAFLPDKTDEDPKPAVLQSAASPYRPPVFPEIDDVAEWDRCRVEPPRPEPQNGLRSEVFVDAPLLATEEVATGELGVFIRRRLVRDPADNSPVVVETTVRRGEGGREQVLLSKARMANQVLLQKRPDTGFGEFEEVVTGYGGRIVEKIYGMDAYVVELAEADFDIAPNAWEYFRKQTQQVLRAAFNDIAFPDSTPDDTNFGLQWSHENTGQSGGTPDADTDATDAWNLTIGHTGVVVAVLDTGVEFTHPDLNANIWTNSNENPTNGIDDDGNGLVDDMQGWNFGQTNNLVMDVYGHGTRVAGIVGAIGSNGVGVAGVCWRVQLMCVKMNYNESTGAAKSSAMAASINYAASNGADVINFSFGNYSWNSLMKQAVANAEEQDVVFVCSTDNSSNDCDVTLYYPGAYGYSNIIAAASTDRNDAIYRTSGFGATNVDLGAPGVSVLTTRTNAWYSYGLGTSYASPCIAGAAALVRSVHPDWDYARVKAALMDHVDPLPALAGKCVTGGRLNIYQALIGSITLDVELDVSSDIVLSWHALSNATFQVESCSNLVSNVWDDVGAPILGDGGITNVAPDTTGTTRCFYRLSVQ